MKKQILCLLLPIAFLFPAYSQEKQGSVDAPPAPSPGKREGGPKPFQEKALERVNMVPTTWIGVMTRDPSPELAVHLGVPRGFGLIVADVMGGSPAAKAGLEKNDLLLRYDDQRLVNAEQFMTLVRAGKNGDKVEFTLLRQGKEQKATVTLGTRDMPEVGALPEFRNQLVPFGKAQAGQWRYEQPGVESMGQIRERMQKAREEMERTVERMRGNVPEWKEEKAEPSCEGCDKEKGGSQETDEDLKPEAKSFDKKDHLEKGRANEEKPAQNKDKKDAETNGKKAAEKEKTAPL